MPIAQQDSPSSHPAQPTTGFQDFVVYGMLMSPPWPGFAEVASYNMRRFVSAEFFFKFFGEMRVFFDREKRKVFFFGKSRERKSKRPVARAQFKHGIPSRERERADDLLYHIAVR